MRVSIPVLIVGLLLSSSVTAQSMMVIGANSFARDCYQASTSAALSGSASGMDLSACDRALEDGGLRKRDLVATYVNRGVVHVALENYSAAAKDYNKALAMNPELPEAYVNRGNLLFMAERYTEAISDYDRSLELGFAQAHIALINRGMVYEIIGNLARAKSDYTAALEKVVDWPTALQKLERVNRKLNRELR